VEWEIEVTDEFERWWDSLTEAEQVDVRAIVLLLRSFGPALRHPFCSGVKSTAVRLTLKPPAASACRTDGCIAFCLAAI
jgi:hypothetical protein